MVYGETKKSKVYQTNCRMVNNEKKISNKPWYNNIGPRQRQIQKEKMAILSNFTLSKYPV